MGARLPATVVAIVPCLDEEATVGTVVRDLIAAVPGITVYVFDNGSTDRTVEVATEAGAIVRHETRRGKGNVVRRAFGDLQADVFVLIDGDDTYDVTALPGMIALLHSRPLRPGGRRTTGGRLLGVPAGSRERQQLLQRRRQQAVRRAGPGHAHRLPVLSERFVKSSRCARAASRWRPR